MGGELRVLAVAAGPSQCHAMSAAITSTRVAYRRQTPTVWQTLGRAVWAALEATGRRRAARELHDVAQRWDAIDPSLAAQLRAAAHRNLNDNRDIQ
jgi:hypothetical protein